MTDADWGDLESLPPPKAGVPKAVWFCGGGCLLAVLVVLASMWWVFDWVQEGSDAELQWSRLEEVLPYDERSTSHDLIFGGRLPLIGIEGFAFEPHVDEGSTEPASRPWAALLRFPIETEDDDAPEISMSDEAWVRDAAEFELSVQGRPLEGLRGQENNVMTFPGTPSSPSGAVAYLRLTPLDEHGHELWLKLWRPASSDPITDEEIREFLAPFHVGLDR